MGVDEGMKGDSDCMGPEKTALDWLCPIVGTNSVQRKTAAGKMQRRQFQLDGDAPLSCAPQRSEGNEGTFILHLRLPESKKLMPPLWRGLASGCSSLSKLLLFFFMCEVS